MVMPDDTLAALKEALRSVTYDQTMANYAQQFVGHAEVRRRSAGDAEQAARYFELERSAFLECFLLHFRNLMEFFQHQRGDRKVFWAGDFTKSKWPPAEAKAIWNRLNRPTPDSQPVQKAISTRLSHIGKDRLKFDLKWDPPKMYAEIRELVRIFRGDLRNDLRDALADVPAEGGDIQP
jgi:hypothetical protein